MSSTWLLKAVAHAGLPVPAPAQLEAQMVAQPGAVARWDAIARTAGLTPAGLAILVAHHFRLETADLAQARRGALRLVPERIARRHGVLAMAETDREIVLATSDPTDMEAEHAIGFASGRRPVFRIAAPGAIRDAIDAGYSPVPLGRPSAPVPLPPTAPPAEPVLSEVPGLVHGAGGASAAQRILLVDDDPVARTLVRSLLEREPYTVYEVEDGAQALEALEVGTYALVLTDLRMPVLDGRGLVRQIRASRRAHALPIVVLTGSEDETEEAALMDLGADDYVRKPFDPARLGARVRAVLRRSAM